MVVKKSSFVDEAFVFVFPSGKAEEDADPLI
jgi:hypothetical protein